MIVFNLTTQTLNVNFRFELNQGFSFLEQSVFYFHIQTKFDIFYISLSIQYNKRMHQTLKNTTLNDEDIKFLKRQLKKGYLTWIIFSLFSIVSPGVCIYMIITNEEISDKATPILAVIIIFGFWIYITIKAIIDTTKEQQNLLLQKKVEGNIIVLEKEIITTKGHEANDTDSYEITIYSEIEEKHKNISVKKKYYEKIQIGDMLWIEYYLDSNYIKTLIFEQQDIKSKYFTN